MDRGDGSYLLMNARREKELARKECCISSEECHRRPWVQAVWQTSHNDLGSHIP